MRYRNITLLDQARVDATGPRVVVCYEEWRGDVLIEQWRRAYKLGSLTFEPKVGHLGMLRMPNYFLRSVNLIVAERLRAATIRFWEYYGPQDLTRDVEFPPEQLRALIQKADELSKYQVYGA